MPIEPALSAPSLHPWPGFRAASTLSAQARRAALYGERVTDDILLIDTVDRVRTLTLNRPQARNALSSALRDRLFGALAGADPVFCAGLDLKELGGQSALPDISPRWPPMTKPVIGAINGAAVTGGLELVL